MYEKRRRFNPPVEPFLGSKKYVACPKCILPAFPFKTWLGMAYKIYDMRTVKPYKLNELWREYRMHCISIDMSHEPCKKFGLWG